MDLRNLWSGLFWIAISLLVVCVGSIRGSIGTLQYPGPGFIPFLSGVILGVFGIILVVTNYLKKKEGKIKNLWMGMKWQNVILAIISLFIYALLLTKIGYLITTFGLMTLLFGLVGKPRLWIQVLGGLISAVVSYLIFSVWLNIQLPEGILGF